MTRPLAWFGMIVIALAVFTYLLIPSWRGSALGVGVLIVCLAAGSYAVNKDLQNFTREMDAQDRAQKEAAKRQPPDENEKK